MECSRDLVLIKRAFAEFLNNKCYMGKSKLSSLVANPILLKPSKVRSLLRVKFTTQALFLFWQLQQTQEN